jgi:hypothetical protein
MSELHVIQMGAVVMKTASLQRPVAHKKFVPILNEAN